MPKCAWCESPFVPRATGGEPQRASVPISRATAATNIAALIAWVEEQVAIGRVTVSTLQVALMQKRSQQSQK